MGASGGFMTGTIGEQLKQARIDQGLTLDQVAQATHIRKHYLEALEGDERSLLPSNVQGRGFLRLYAGHLNLPVEPLLAAWDGKEYTPASPPTETSPAPSTSGFTSEEKQALTSLGSEEETTTSIFEPEGPSEESSSKIFQEIGADLRQQREGLGLSLAEVERYTRLRQHYINAMEEGRMEDMPSPVQGKGMLSNYAAFLNMDEEKVLLRFAEGLQARRVERIPKSPPPGVFSGKKKSARQAPFWKRFLTPDLVFGVVLAGIILFFIVWTAARIDTLQNTETEPTTPAISEVLLTPASARTQPTGEVNPTEGDITPLAPMSSQTQESTLPTNTPPPLQAPATVNQPGTVNQATATATILPMNDDPLQVYIVARQRAWLRVISDDKVEFLGRVVPGNAYAFSGTKKVEILTGNAAGLQIIYNQTDLGTLGDLGEVVGLVFVPEGIQTPTPAAPPTSTPTKLSTITALPTSTPPATPTVTPFIP